MGQRTEKMFKAIYYARKTFNEGQEKYSTIEKEMLENDVFLLKIQALHIGVPCYNTH